MSESLVAPGILLALLLALGFILWRWARAVARAVAGAPRPVALRFSPEADAHRPPDAWQDNPCYVVEFQAPPLPAPAWVPPSAAERLAAIAVIATLLLLALAFTIAWFVFGGLIAVVGLVVAWFALPALHRALLQMGRGPLDTQVPRP